MARKKIQRFNFDEIWQLGCRPFGGGQFRTPDEMLEAAYEYFQWCDQHPLIRKEAVKYQGFLSIGEIEVRRPYSMEGLTLHLGVASSFFRSRKIEIRKKAEEANASTLDIEMLEAIERVELIVRTQQIEGALISEFNAGLVARLNNITDTSNTGTIADAAVQIIVRDSETAKNLKGLALDL